jgi:16S rRNA (adenine1518-N6/adenine1519-N6)-dimethyltransferase
MQKKIYTHGSAHNIGLKKEFGQHFLREQAHVDTVLAGVNLTDQSSIIEIGCGDGFLTKDLVAAPHKRIWIFELDAEWADYVKNKYASDTLQIFNQDFLTVEPSTLAPHAPWHILANLPYNITFPILEYMQKNRLLFTSSVIMIQEEVAQKLVACSGRGYGYVSLFFQHYFSMRLMSKVPPGAFYPPPKVFSRLLYIEPRAQVLEIKHEEAFWKFIRRCFKQPRRTLRNNLIQFEYKLDVLEHTVLEKRAQQLTFDDLYAIWQKVIKMD